MTAPQPETTQLRAAEAMAADWEAEHWQPKSRAEQPTPEAAELMQEVCLGSVNGFWLLKSGEGRGGRSVRRKRELWLQRRRTDPVLW